jgi:hypothetical protein
MDVAEIESILKSSLNGFDINVREELREERIWLAIGEAVMELKKILRRPVSEKQYTCVVGERGLTLDNDFLEFAPDVTHLRLDLSGNDSEGEYIPIVSEHTLIA